MDTLLWLVGIAGVTIVICVVFFLVMTIKAVIKQTKEKKAAKRSFAFDKGSDGTSSR